MSADWKKVYFRLCWHVSLCIFIVNNVNFNNNIKIMQNYVIWVYDLQKLLTEFSKVLNRTDYWENPQVLSGIPADPSSN